MSDHDHTHRPDEVHEGETPEEAAARYRAEEEALIAETSEGVQGLRSRTDTSAGELRQEVGAVLRLPEGGYVGGLRKDPWGNDYRYAVPSQHGKPFDVFSYGADGQEGGEGNDADVGNWNAE